MSIKRWRKADEILTICSFCLTIEKVGSGFLYHNAGQDAPPTGLVSYGSRYNPTAVLLYKVELRQTSKMGDVLNHQCYLLCRQVRLPVVNATP